MEIDVDADDLSAAAATAAEATTDENEKDGDNKADEEENRPCLLGPQCRRCMATRASVAQGCFASV